MTSFVILVCSGVLGALIGPAIAFIAVRAVRTDTVARRVQRVNNRPEPGVLTVRFPDGSHTVTNFGDEDAAEVKRTVHHIEKHAQMAGL